MAEMNHNLHNDERPTLVQIGDMLYELVPSATTFEQVKAMPVNEAPHVRHLNAIPIRSKEEQERKNKEFESMHKLYQNTSSKKKTQTMEEVVQDGGEVSETVKKLLEEKKEAKKSGDKKKLRLLRKQLRKLDYKRYVGKKAKEA